MDNNNTLIDEQSILTTIKKLLGLPKEYTVFDLDIIIHINSVLSILLQMGVGPETGFTITGYSELWNQYITEENPNTIQNIKTYIYNKVRLMFDPPTNGNLLDALNKMISELEYRLYVEKGGY